MSKAKAFLANPISLLVMIAMTATIGLLPVSTPQQQIAHAQYGGGGAQTATPQQLQQCEQLGIARGECSDTTILAKQRVTAAQANPQTGSGTPMLSTETGQMVVFIGVLGAIFGGVAALFFLKGRGSRPATT